MYIVCPDVGLGDQAAGEFPAGLTVYGNDFLISVLYQHPIYTRDTQQKPAFPYVKRVMPVCIRYNT